MKTRMFPRYTPSRLPYERVWARAWTERRPLHRGPLVMVGDEEAHELNLVRFCKARIMDRYVGLYDARRVKRARRRAPPTYLRNVFAGYLVQRMVTA